MNGNIFPLPFNSHLIFCVIAFVFFIIQFFRVRRTYQLIFAIIIPATLLIYLSDNKLFFYCIGIFEFVMLIIAGITIHFDRKKLRRSNQESIIENQQTEA